MKNNELKNKVLDKIRSNFKLSDKQKDMLEKCFVDDINVPRLETVIDIMIEYSMGADILIPYILFQAYKTNKETAQTLAEKDLTPEEKKLFETFITVKDVRSLSRSGEAESIRKIFVAICQDIRIVIVKFATILYDLKLIKPPMSQEDLDYVKLVNDVFAPLAERLGLSFVIRICFSLSSFLR